MAISESIGERIDLTRDIEASLQRGSSLPSSWYTDPAVFDLELRAIFERDWQYAAHESEVDNPGDFLTCTVGRVPVVLTRADDGTIRAFVNVCRHRLHEVVQGRGHRKTLQCPYHGWTYNLDGSLRAAPRCELDEHFDKTDFPLYEVSVETAGPLIFVNVDPNGRPLPEAIRRFPALCESRGFQLEGVKLRRSVTYHVACNWKVAVEANECYHCPTIHPEFHKNVHTEPEIMRLESEDDEVFGFVSRFRDAPAADNSSPDYQLYYIWPSFAIARQSTGDGGFLTLLFVPVDAQNTRFEASFFFPPDVDEEVVNRAVTASAQVTREDSTAMESCQRGHAAGVGARAYMMMPSERVGRTLNRRVYEAVKEASSQNGGE